VLLIGCVKSKRPEASSARDLYTSTLFVRRRAYAEASGEPWFIVSSRLGLVAPEEYIAPYEMYLPDMSAAYRAAWGRFVVAQLAERMTLAGVTVEVHAGDAYVAALRSPLEAVGTVVVDPVIASSFGETLTWYDTHSPTRTDGTDVSACQAPVGPVAPVIRPVIDAHLVDDVVRILVDRSRRMTVRELLASSRSSLNCPGMYSWWVDSVGARDLAAGLYHPIAEGLIYSGQAGATRWPSGQRSTNTLWGRLAGMHLGGRAQLSTFRLTLAAILQPGAGSSLSESALTAWMTEHLTVVSFPMDDGDAIDDVETDVLARLDPPLNLAKRPSTPVRATLSRLRRELGVR
jgi:hypothetical protein